MPRKLYRSFIVRVIHHPQLSFVVHNLRTGEVRRFSNWQQLQNYLEQPHKPRLR